MAFVEFEKTHDVGFALVDTTGSGTLNADFVSMAKSHHAAIVIIAGTLAADVVLTLRESIIPGAAPGGDKEIAGKTVTLGVAESDSEAVLEVSAEELDVAGGFKNISLRSVAAGAAEIMAVIIRWPTRYSPL